MKIEIKEGKVTIDAYELIDNFSGEEKLKLIECLACQNEIIKHVADQIISGWTENGWHGSKGYSETPFTELDKARRFVAENSGELAKKEIQKLENLVKVKEEFLNKSWTENEKLQDELREMRAVLST